MRNWFPFMPISHAKRLTFDAMVWSCHTISMAKMTIRSTYSLDVGTVQKLEQLAEHWNTSKSDTLRRAIDRMAEQTLRNRTDAIEALEQLQRLVAKAGIDVEQWAKDAERERRASSRRRMDRIAR